MEKFRNEPCANCGQSRRRLNGAWLKEQREKAGVKQAEFARRAGVSISLISDIEHNKRNPNADVLALYQSL